MSLGPLLDNKNHEDRGGLRGIEEVDTLKVTVRLKNVVVEVLDQMHEAERRWWLE